MTQDTIARLYSSYFRMDSLVPYQIDNAGSDIYMRWSDDDVNPVFIRRTSINGNITQNDFAFDLWSNRTTATYAYNLPNIA